MAIVRFRRGAAAHDRAGPTLRRISCAAASVKASREAMVVALRHQHRLVFGNLEGARLVADDVDHGSGLARQRPAPPDTDR